MFFPERYWLIAALEQPLFSERADWLILAWAIASFKQSLKFFISVHTPLQVTGFEIAGANAPVIPQTPLAESLVGILGVIGSGVFHRLVIAGKVVGLGVPLDFSGGGSACPSSFLFTLLNSLF